jgi:hypothetical protein
VGRVEAVRDYRSGPASKGGVGLAVFNSLLYLVYPDELGVILRYAWIDALHVPHGNIPIKVSNGSTGSTPKRVLLWAYAPSTVPCAWDIRARTAITSGFATEHPNRHRRCQIKRGAYLFCPPPAEMPYVSLLRGILSEVHARRCTPS